MRGMARVKPIYGILMLMDNLLRWKHFPSRKNEMGKLSHNSYVELQKALNYLAIKMQVLENIQQYYYLWFADSSVYLVRLMWKPRLHQTITHVWYWNFFPWCVMFAQNRYYFAMRLHQENCISITNFFVVFK